MLFHTLWHVLSGARISVLEIRSYFVITIKEIATIFFLIVLSFILWRLIPFAQNQEDIFYSPTNLICQNLWGSNAQKGYRIFVATYVKLQKCHRDT